MIFCLEYGKQTLQSVDSHSEPERKCPILLFQKRDIFGYIYLSVNFYFLQGKTSITQCVEGQGYESYKCNPTSLHSGPIWNHQVNTSDCVGTAFLKWEKDVRNMIFFLFVL